MQSRNLAARTRNEAGTSYIYSWMDRLKGTVVLSLPLGVILLIPITAKCPIINRKPDLLSYYRGPLGEHWERRFLLVPGWTSNPPLHREFPFKGKADSD